MSLFCFITFTDSISPLLGWYIENDGYYFDFVLENGQHWTRMYQLVDRNFLGKIIREGTDTAWSRWIEDMFEWSAWRYIGIGFGDIRGISMVSVRLR